MAIEHNLQVAPKGACFSTLLFFLQTVGSYGTHCYLKIMIRFICWVLAIGIAGNKFADKDLKSRRIFALRFRELWIVWES